MPNIYCYYHRTARLEIIQRNGETYAVCPDCRELVKQACQRDLNHALFDGALPSDDVLHKIVDVTPDDRKAIARAYHKH